MNIGSWTLSSRGTFVTWVALLLLLLVAPAVLAQVSAQSTSFSFALLTPNVALASSTVPGTLVMAGDTVRLTGDGTFDTSTGAVSGGGSFTHLRSDGTVVSQGSWEVTSFVSFISYGGPSPGIQGGLFTATISVKTGPETFKGITFVLSCIVNAPAGAPTFDSAILPGLFGTPVSGTSLFGTPAGNISNQS